METITICLKKLEENEFFIKGKENIVLKGENNEVKIGEIKASTKICLIKKEEEEVIRKIKPKEYLFTVILTFIILIYDIICLNITNLSEMIEPLYEEYSFLVDNKQKKYVFEYHKGEFDIFHHYRYPFMSGNVGQLSTHFSINYYAIKRGFLLAKIYYAFLGVPISLVSGIGFSIAWNGMFFHFMIGTFLFWIFFMCLYLEKRKKKLIFQLESELL